MGADRRNGGKVGFNREFLCELMLCRCCE